MRYLLDTNILLHYVRLSDLVWQIERTYNLTSPDNQLILSIVSVGEIESIALQNRWGEQKMEKLKNILNKLVITDIKPKRVIARYAEIDAYSQNKLPARPLPLTARNMGKNDLWIAATASVLDATLLTTDLDFEHLNGVFLKVEKVG